MQLIDMDLNLTFEITAVIFGLAFLFLVIAEKRIGWIFGIIGSAISVYLFIYTKLYSEAILYTYYVVMGFYGWYIWGKKSDQEESLPVTKLSWISILKFIGLGICLALGLGYTFRRYTDASSPWLDSFTTIFSFIATYLEAQKVLTAWGFWIITNGATIFLYSSKNLDLYALLQLVYFIMSFVGYYRWNKSFKSHLKPDAA